MARQAGDHIEHFMVLGRRRSRYHNRLTPEAHRLIEDELYHLAQAIAAREWPTLQRELTAARIEFMALLRKHKASISGDVFAPGAKRRQTCWSDHQVTPEVSSDPALTGLIVPKELSRRLIRLHKQQVALITDLLARGR